MSGSELSDAPDVAVPPDSELENSLRREVNRINKTGADVTLRAVRTASEKKLGLPEHFYKSHAVWKGKSEAIVRDQVDTEEDAPSSPVLKSKAKPKPPPREESESPRPTKRKSSERQSPSVKKRKTQTVDSDDKSSPLSDAGSVSEPEEKPKKVVPTKKAVKAPPAKKAQKIVEESDGPENKSDSEMSVVLDEEPKPKRKSKSKSSEPKPKKSKATKSKSTTEDDPDQAEIKRLQGWLVKCGIRKVWGIYLKPYETPKAKIKHLREMLADVGMTGRYSVEKAREIKEARELAEEIEAVQEGEQRWGTGGDQGSDDDSQPKGRLVRGQRAAYDFLSSDGEETS